MHLIFYYNMHLSKVIDILHYHILDLVLHHLL